MMDMYNESQTEGESFLVTWREVEIRSLQVPLCGQLLVIGELFTYIGAKSRRRMSSESKIASE